MANSSLAFVSLCLCACSFIGVRGPPSRSAVDGGSISCRDDYALVAIDAVGAGVASLYSGELLDAGAKARSETGTFDFAYEVSVAFLVSDAVYIASAICGAYNVHQCRNAKRAERIAAEAIRQLREQKQQIEQRELGRLRAQERAASLTKIAAEAARNGDCATVNELDSQVRDTDAGFHDTVFAHDAAIARCLAASTSPASP